MKSRHVFMRLWFYLKPYKMSILLAFFLKVLSVVMSVLEPFVLGLAITEIGNNLIAIAKGVEGASMNYSYIAAILALYFVRALFFEIGSFGANYFMTKVVQASIKDLRSALSQKINKIPISYFDKHQFGDLLGRFTSDVDSVSNALQQSFLQMVNAILTIVLALAMTFYIDSGLSLILLLAVPLIYFSSQFVLKRSQPYFKEQAKVLGEMNAFVQERLTGFTVLKLYGREETSINEFHDITNKLEKVGFKASFISGLMMPVLHFISDSVYLVIALVAGLKVLAGKLTIGNMQAFVQYTWQISQPIQTMTQLAPMIQSAKSSLERIFDVLDEADDLSMEKFVLTKPLSGQVSFKNVNFSYRANQELIKDFNLEVSPGEMVAIVGPTGAGKTTLINLLMRFYDVTSGSITIDGYDIRDLSRKDYRRQFGMVLQDAWLFGASIKENLQFGNLEASDTDIIDAAKTANVDHFIRTLPGGYDMVINQESSNISLGQKQLLTIARALLANPKILILDEATSSVDTRLELLIQKAMKVLMQGRTSFVIAHRLSTIQEADKILVLKDGRIIEQGNHQSLLEQNGFYSELYHSQFKNAQ
ncbi:ABC transporter ATP-binding protein [Streptococcus uberis]|uniref:ABC transporter ATP-binding protein n=1 Tax=Streptococcus uberis TaxID=1349 RepID=UPI0012B65C80|nr:ABC transporter ATP-binding protein [Streptococcus uberis]MTB48587.1 ATP-binding cassette domain-containing protein [Streptococcus uberis]MTB99117.1 ATP-binding cassette domain-containing protein [Streptococcus uberis]